MIKIIDLSLTFENKKIFENANIEIPKNKITVIAGPNGVGKTTLLRIISGAVKVKNVVIEKNCKEIFFLPQKIRYPEGITLWEYLMSSYYKDSFKWYITKEEKDAADKVLEELSLSDRKNVLIDNLSSGELQKANIATALISNADCLLLDEPTSNMDLINQIKILDIVKKLTNKGITCIVIMHDLNLSASYGDYFIGMNQSGEIIRADKEHFFTSENLGKIYGINFEVVKNDKNFHIQIFN